MTIVGKFISITGRVQGVGFRPFVHREAVRLGLVGSVRNGPQGVEIEAEGDERKLSELIRVLTAEPPPSARITGMRVEALVPAGRALFSIEASKAGETTGAQVPADVATCIDCRTELFDPANRRFQYAFLSCAECGPRFTLAETSPFDRGSTTMAAFPPCDACLAEHDSPLDRRFHAQTISCPECGPRLQLLGSALEVVDGVGAAVIAAGATALRRGAIVAVKGDGGFLLLADAGREGAVQTLRLRKARPAKPFALLMPSLAAVRAACYGSAAEEDALSSRAAPIVLMRKKPGPDGAHGICAGVAPFSPHFGCMLPSSPLLHLVAHAFDGPLVATSGNRRGEPLARDDGELARLGGIADLFITHDRRVAHRVDDSVVRCIEGRPTVLRLGRGYAPLAIPSPAAYGPRVLGIGAQEKSAFALTMSGQIILSQHLGSLDTLAATTGLEDEIRGFSKLYGREVPPQGVCDLHPDYESSRLAEAKWGANVGRIQHHHAHVLACMAENRLDEPVLGVAWDGSGFGADGTVWGGEFLVVDGPRMSRAGHFKAFPLPGGEAAVREPRRAALGILFELERSHGGLRRQTEVERWLSSQFEPTELAALRASMTARLNSPMTSSVGRLFDAVASLVGLCQRSRYREEAPVALEALAAQATTARAYQIDLAKGQRGALVLDWGGLMAGIFGDVIDGRDRGAIARGFHEALAEGVGAAAERLEKRQVVLTGGVFQNDLLTSLTATRLRRRGFQVYTHQLVPPGDGGIAVGQALFGLLSKGPEGGDDVSGRTR